MWIYSFLIPNIKKDMKTFVTSDTHFGHKEIIRFANRPFDTCFEMDNEIITRWNSRVLPEDTVYHLGDFCVGAYQTAAMSLSLLQGKIKLIKGNHDRTWKLKKLGIDIIGNRFEMGNLIFTHKPLRIVPEGKVNVHGHTHTIYLPGRYINVSLDLTDFYPVPIEEIKEQATKLLSI